MIRKVRFPLKFKLIFIITILLTVAVSFYVQFALDLFKKDKSADIYANGLNNAISLSDRTSFFLSQKLKSIQLMTKAYSTKENVGILTDIFKSNDDFIEFSILEKKKSGYKKVFHLFDNNILESYDVSKDFLKNIENRKSIPYKSIETGGVFLENVTLPDGIPHFLLAFYDKKSRNIVSARISYSKLSAYFKEGTIYESFIVDGRGKKFLDKAGKIVFSSTQSSIPQRLLDIISGTLERGVRKFEDSTSGSVLSAFSKINLFNLYVISEIKEKSAFKAADLLINKSLYYGLLVLALAVIVGVFFSRRMTIHLNTLFSATQKIAEGDFQTKVEVPSGDEIGALSDSFNFMSDEITRFMGEMEEKARLENEVKVAQLVQSSFFPNDDVSIGPVDISAFYEPASECGGDWWGYVEDDNVLVLIIADATGHGVPAALLTATANCSVNTIKLFSEKDPDLLRSPAKILDIMNHATTSVGSDIMMTCFVGVLDKKTGELKYSNASHNQPLIYKNTGKEPVKGDFLPLMEANGPRLGHEANPNYTEAVGKLEKGDSLILFTDGILEAVNSEDKQWGQRRFIKSLISNIKSDVKTSRRSILKEAYDFFGGIRPDDDVTLVLANWTGESSVVDEELPPEITEVKIILENEDAITKLIPELEIGIIQFSKDFNTESAKLILVEGISNLEKIPKEIWETNPCKVIYLTSENDETNIREALSRYPLHHIVGLNAANLSGELRICINNLLKRKIGSIHKYIGEENIIHAPKISSNKEIDQIIDESLVGFEFKDYFDSPKKYLKVMANELITNALFHSGKGDEFEKRSQMDRKEQLNVGTEESIEFSIGMNEHFLAISVTDKSGRLSRDILVKSLERSFSEKAPEQKDGGAGLGLYMTFNHANQFIVNTKEGQKTEVICIIDSNKRYKKYKERVTSFHVYNEE